MPILSPVSPRPEGEEETGEEGPRRRREDSHDQAVVGVDSGGAKHGGESDKEEEGEVARAGDQREANPEPPADLLVHSASPCGWQRTMHREPMKNEVNAGAGGLQ